MVAQCGSGQPCAPYSGLTAELVSFNNNCPEIVGFVYNFVGQNINISSITFGNIPDIAQTVTVEYKLSSDSSYTLYSNSVAVAVNGQPAINPTFTLAAGQPYDIRITNNCSSPAAPFVQSINAPGNPYNVKITSDMIGITLTGVGGITGFTFSGTLTPGQTQTGNHTAFSGVISVDLSGSPFFVPSNVTLLKNGTQIDCINITTSGTFFFGSHSFALNDQLELQLNTGGC